MSPFATAALVSLGSALGGLGRFALGQAVATRLDGAFPWGILLVNVLGCLAIGVCYGVSEREWVRCFVMAGILGGFTTFSAFSLDTLKLAEAGRWGQAGGYVVLSLATCLIVVWLGTLAGRAFR
jgi:CrcB protein